MLRSEARMQAAEPGGHSRRRVNKGVGIAFHSALYYLQYMGMANPGFMAHEGQEASVSTFVLQIANRFGDSVRKVFPHYGDYAINRYFVLKTPIVITQGSVSLSGSVDGFCNLQRVSLRLAIAMNMIQIAAISDRQKAKG